MIETTRPAQDEAAVWPLAPSAAAVSFGRRQLNGLAGKNVAFIWDDLFRGDDMFEAFEAAAEEAGVAFRRIPHTVFGDLHGPHERAVVARIPELLREHEIDAAIVGVGACGSCTPAVIRACQAVEEAGVPAMALVSSGFVRQATATARAVGLEKLWIAEYPGVIAVDTDEAFAQKVHDHVVPSLFDGFRRLTHGYDGDAGDAATEPGVRDIVVSGRLEEIQDYFDDRQWSDGLPIVPPTIERVEHFLAYTDRDPLDEIGVMLPARRAVTVWSVAVNGVMAGCRPEYMPVLLAVTEVMADPEWRLEDAGCTPGWEPLILISGPLASVFGLNDGAGMMRVGNRANSTIGRFGRLIMRNLAGFLTPPGDTDKAAIGRTFNVAMAESDEHTHAIGWSTSREECGYVTDDTVVSVQSCVAISGPAYTGGAAEEQLAMLARYAADTIGPWAFTNLYYRGHSALVLMSPSVAQSLAEAGHTKDSIRRYLVDHATMDVGGMEAQARMARGNEFSFTDLAAKGMLPDGFPPDVTTETQVGVLAGPENVRIILGGDPGRNQNRIYWNNHEQGLPIHRRVECNARVRELVGSSGERRVG
ncbi:hypothetical protein ABKW28_20370 [Nocardioides sp. 31GB23]|uniref:UGSC family (seleno)protein n=1 Tax=Nocardioides sp. 31GB23 TaxID=3156065 RepID=UPI0032AFC71D